MPGACIGICVDETLGYRVVIAALEVIEPRFCVIIVAEATNEMRLIMKNQLKDILRFRVFKRKLLLLNLHTQLAFWFLLLSVYHGSSNTAQMNNALHNSFP